MSESSWGERNAWRHEINDVKHTEFTHGEREGIGRLVRDAEKLAKLERHVMLRPEEAPEWAEKWKKLPAVPNLECGSCWWGLRDKTNSLVWVSAPDYLPNEPGPITLMLVGDDE